MPIFVGDTTGGRTATTLASTGSTWFGNTSDDAHNFQGTLYLTGAAVFNMAAASTGDFTVKSTTSTHMLFVDSSAGRIGIGTSSPDNTLHVKSAGTTHVKVESEAGYEAALKVKAGGQASAYIWQPGSTSDLRFYINGADRVHIDNDGSVGIGTTSPDCMLHVAGAFAAAGPSETFQTFANGDYTPSLAGGNLFKTYDGAGQGATSLDGGVAGQTVTIISTDAFTYMVSGGNLKGGTTNITTAAGDVTTWIYDGTYWYLMNFMDQSADLSGGH